jgi:hypothetical protein
MELDGHLYFFNFVGKFTCLEQLVLVNFSNGYFLSSEHELVLVHSNVVEM